MSPPPSRVITRNRERLACQECRRRKLKCDRSHPCGSCVKRGDGTSCAYQRLPHPFEKRVQQRVETQARLEHLEQLVQQLASQPSVSTGGPLISLTPPLQFENEVVVNGSQDGILGSSTATDGLSYNGATHWSAMLDDINELRLAMPIDDAFISSDFTEDHSESTGVELLFGGGTILPLDIVLATYLPPRQEVDRMISAYFRADAVAAPYIHVSQFRRLYKDFWEDRMTTPPLWISLLFSICHISANSLRHQETGHGEDRNRYSLAAAHCLAIGHYFRPGMHAIEALTLFSQAQCLTSPEMPTDIGALMGLIIRLATTMGYHKDPEPLRLSPFEKEMRRRTWSFCMQLDIIVSFHLGLPPGVQYPTWDTKPPMVVLDTDFDENSEVLPPSRTEAELNRMSFYLAKHRFMSVFEKIIRHTLSTTADSLEAEKLDAEVRAVYETVPELLKPRPMAESIVDSASLIVTRICVSFIYYKSLCVLHRPYVTRGRPKSATICYDFASRMVETFVDAYYEFTPGGQAETESWFLSAISWHDFLFGIMALCLVLCVSISDSTCPPLDIDAGVRLLTKARELCESQQSKRHRDTRRVLALVNAVIFRFSAKGYGSPDISMTMGFDNPPEALTTNATLQNNIVWNNTWDFGDSMTGLAQDPSWAYFDQFLAS